MPIWKNASSVFLGGTEQIKQLKGRRVRPRTALRVGVYDPIHNSNESIELAAGRVGLIAHPHPTLFHFLIVFPTKLNSAITTLDNLGRSGDFKVVIVNEPTFKHQFEIEG